MGNSHRWRGRRAGSIVAAIALVLMLVVGPRGALALFQQLGNSSSPATGHAEVIAQGVSTLPDGDSAWRVISATAGAFDSTEPATQDLGFALATDAGILVNDYTTGGQARLPGGEAIFTSSGAYQQRVSLSGDSAGYLQISLVGAGSSTDGLNVAYGSDGFSSPGGRRDIDLVRDVLGDGEETTINAGSAPSLIYVLSGNVVVDDGNNTTTLNAGNGATVNGQFAVEAQGPAVIVAAVIGDEVPAPPRISGTVTLDIRACPVDVTKQMLQDSAAAGSSETSEKCSALADPAKAGLAIDLTPSGGNAIKLSAADLTNDDGVVVWNALAFGDYSLGDISAYPDGYNDSIMSDGNLNLGDHGDFSLSRDNPDIYRVIYLIHAPTATGSIQIAYQSCRVASFDDFDASACEPYVGPVTTQIFVNGEEDPLTELDAEGADGPNTLIWNDLPVAVNEQPTPTDPGAYQIGFGLENNDSTQIVVDGATYDDTTGNFRLNLTPEHPNATLTFYAVNLDDSLGRIYLQGQTCPTVDAAVEECTTHVQLPAVTITTGSGGSFDQSTATDANPDWLWSGLAFDDTYTISAANITAPDGYQVRTIVNDDTSESGDSLTIANSFDAPTSTVSVILDPIGEEDPGTPVDTDSDGLSDDDETTAGTDVSNPDSDADCYTDGSEVTAGTDPLDPASTPDGDCEL